MLRDLFERLGPIGRGLAWAFAEAARLGARATQVRNIFGRQAPEVPMEVPPRMYTIAQENEWRRGALDLLRPDVVPRPHEFITTALNLKRKYEYEITIHYRDIFTEEIVDKHVSLLLDEPKTVEEMDEDLLDIVMARRGLYRLDKEYPVKITDRTMFQRLP